MKIVFFVGFLLVFGVVGGVENLPPDATISQWITLCALGLVGFGAMAAGLASVQGNIKNNPTLW